MIFERRSELEGTHAFLSPSSYHWINYTEEKLVDRYLKSLAVQRGTELHEFASRAIELNVPLKGRTTLSMFVNDAIGYKMSSEVPLFEDWLCYGTTDAISYRRNYLRIHDLKTGETEAHFEQLRVYAALFCLNYQRRVQELRREGKSDMDIARRFDLNEKELHFDPKKMNGIELRIYQLGEIRTEMADPEEIEALMALIVSDVNVIKSVRSEE